MVDHPEKITFAEIRAAGVRKVLIYCRDYQCNHVNVVPDDADRWPDELRISDIEDRFVCTEPAANVVPTSGRIGKAPRG